MNIKKLFLAGIIVILIVAIPISVISLQHQQVTTSKATAATSLSFSGVPQSVKPGDPPFTLSIQLDPGSNLVSFVALAITYDKTIITTDTGFTVNQNSFPTIVEQPVYQDKVNTCNGNLCTITITVNTGSDSTKVVTKPTTVATLSMKAVGKGVASLDFKIPPTNVRALDPNSNISQDVLSSATGTKINISDQTTPTVAPTQPPVTVTQKNLPICDGLTITLSKKAPVQATFVVSGHATTSAITKAVFDFGDGKTQTITKTLKKFTATTYHTYPIPNLYVATAQLTDGTGALSNFCTQSFTVASPASISASPTVDTTTSSSTDSSLPATGPNDILLELGAVGFMAMLGGLFLVVFL